MTIGPHALFNTIVHNASALRMISDSETSPLSDTFSTWASNVAAAMEIVFTIACFGFREAGHEPSPIPT